MYNSLTNQLYHLAHFGLAFYLLFFLFPKILFQQDKSDKLSNFFANFTKMIALTIGFGYVLLILKLYEAFALIIIFGVLLYLRWSIFKPEQKPFTWIAYTLDFFDGHLRLWPGRTRDQNVQFGRWLIHRALPRLASLIKNNLAILLILAIAAYIRFPDALLNPAPNMSDGYVTLAWMKYVDERILFHDGIYPQGLYFYLTFLEKFSFLNPLYILKYAGPLNAMLIVLGMYFGVSRMLEDKTVGLVAALLFGVLGQVFLGDDWSRQAATNSQEFGFIFITPGFYFLLAYLKSGKKSDLWAGLASVCVVGLVHPVAYVLMVMAGGAVVIASIFNWKKNRRTFHILGIGVVSGITTLLPIGIGLLYRIPFNSSGATYATSTVAMHVPFPALRSWDIVGVLAILAIFAFALLQWRKKTSMVAWFSVAWLGLSTFFLYYAGGPITHNLVLISRTLDLWAIVATLSIATAFHALVITFNEAPLSARVSGTLTLIMVAGSVAYSRPTPIYPYKMQWESDLEAYLEIYNTNKHQTYLIVAPDQNYSLVLGSGYLLDTNVFLQMFNPAATPLTLYGTRRVDSNIPPDVYIYDEKQIYEVDKSNSVYPIEAPIYKAEIQDMKKLRLWLNAFTARHPGALQVFYEDAHLKVYHVRVEG